MKYHKHLMITFLILVLQIAHKLSPTETSKTSFFRENYPHSLLMTQVTSYDTIKKDTLMRYQLTL